jgi:rhamnose utilization protein RhaD (predicted bifunctional aldolase and dehydrogenase)
MQDKGIPLPSVEEQIVAAERAAMRLLLEDRGLFTFGEVNKAAGGRVVITADALDRLKQAGLVNEADRYLFASRAAVVGAEVWSRRDA